MVYENLGRDETIGTPWWNPFGVIFPTELDKASSLMAKEARATNPIKLDMQKFLESYVLVSRMNKSTLASLGIEKYASEISTRYNWNILEVTKALSLLEQLYISGRINKIIWNPSGYISSSPGDPGLPSLIPEGIKEVSSSVKFTAVALGILGVGYILSQGRKIKESF